MAIGMAVTLMAGSVGAAASQEPDDKNELQGRGLDADRLIILIRPSIIVSDE